MLDLRWTCDGDNNHHILLPPTLVLLGLNKKADPTITMTKLLDCGVGKRFAIMTVDAINIIAWDLEGLKHSLASDFGNIIRALGGSQLKEAKKSEEISILKTLTHCVHWLFMACNALQ